MYIDQGYLQACFSDIHREFDHEDPGSYPEFPFFGVVGKPQRTTANIKVSVLAFSCEWTGFKNSKDTRIMATILCKQYA